VYRGGQRAAPAVCALHPRALAPARRQCVRLRGEARRLGALQSPLDLSLPVHQVVHPPPQLLLRRAEPRDLSRARPRTTLHPRAVAAAAAAAIAFAAAVAARHRAHSGLPRRLPQPRTHEQPSQRLDRARRVRRMLFRHGARRREAAAQLLLLGVARVRRGGGHAVAVLQLLRLLCEEVAEARHLVTGALQLDLQRGHAARLAPRRDLRLDLGAISARSRRDLRLDLGAISARSRGDLRLDLGAVPRTSTRRGERRHLRARTRRRRPRARRLRE